MNLGNITGKVCTIIVVLLTLGRNSFLQSLRFTIPAVLLTTTELYMSTVQQFCFGHRRYT